MIFFHVVLSSLIQIHNRANTIQFVLSKPLETSSLSSLHALCHTCTCKSEQRICNIHFILFKITISAKWSVSWRSSYKNLTVSNSQCNAFTRTCIWKYILSKKLYFNYGTINYQKHARKSLFFFFLYLMNLKFDPLYLCVCFIVLSFIKYMYL